MVENAQKFRLKTMKTKWSKIAIFKGVPGNMVDNDQNKPKFRN